jgi:hypothetical protein
VERANQQVVIETAHGTGAVLPWETRQALLEWVRPHESAQSIVKTFEARGTSRPVSLSRAEAAHLYGLLNRWADEAGTDELPAGIAELQNALAIHPHGDKEPEH